MSSQECSIIYSNDGSSLNKVGSYIVVSLSINGTQTALFPVPIVKESHESLEYFELTTLKMLSA